MPYGNEPGGKRRTALPRPSGSSTTRRRTRAGSTPAAPAGRRSRRTSSTSRPDPRIQALGRRAEVAHQRPAAGDARPTTATSSAARTVPVISHEIGQWCVYPELRRDRRSTPATSSRGTSRSSATRSPRIGMGDQARAVPARLGQAPDALLQGRHRVGAAHAGHGRLPVARPARLSRARARRWSACSIRSGRRRATSRPRNTAASASSTVPLARLTKRVFTDRRDARGGHRGGPLRPGAAGRAPWPSWKLVDDDGKAVAAGQAARRRRPGRQRHRRWAASSVDLEGLRRARAATGSSSASTGTPFENDWDVWVYPPSVDTQPPPGVTVVERLDDEALAALQRRRQGALAIPPSRVQRRRARARSTLGFSSIFWNTAWTRRQAAAHAGHPLRSRSIPALAGFPDRVPQQLAVVVPRQPGRAR